MPSRATHRMTAEETVAFLKECANRPPRTSRSRIMSVDGAQLSMLQGLRRRGHEVLFTSERFLDAAPEQSPYSTPKMLKAADGKPCPYCEKTMIRGTRRMPTRDHVRPKRAGGTLAAGNVLIVCSPCNGDKGDMMLLEFVDWLARRADPRAEIVRKINPDFGIVNRPGGRPA